MLNDPQIGKMLAKLERFEHTLYDLIFEPVDEVDFTLYETADWLTEIPTDGYRAIDRNTMWGDEEHYGWFHTVYTVPDALDGKPLFLKPDIGCYEGLLFVDGKACGTFANKMQVQYSSHGNHYCDRIVDRAVAMSRLTIDLELYCGHYHTGNHPFSTPRLRSYSYRYNGAEICVKNEEIQDFYFDLTTVRQLVAALPEHDARRGQLLACLYRVHNTVYYDHDNTDPAVFMEAVRRAAPYLKEALAVKSSDSAPFAGLTGHSHMDTAWLWPVAETIKKCARTYSNALSLMEQYPEYCFLQSSSCHSDFIRRYYPELFERIARRVKEGRYEPNGGVWVECDCNITSGESMIRQFLWGRRFTRKYFDYTSDVFWLPDTFGYSAAIPQIMRGCGCQYFMTTKISWNDTNKFPYDTFTWQGIDGSTVLAHFNTTHLYPNPEDLYPALTRDIMQPSVSNMKYAAYGYGDGGGGPTFEMLESARRCVDLDGLGKTEHLSASEFMRRLDESTKETRNTYKGELYLELHRGTLTNQHTIKRNNRKSEVALHDLEFVTVLNALRDQKPLSAAVSADLYQVLLLNQFHDILPGTCIHRAHEESRAQTTGLIREAKARIREAVRADGAERAVTLINSLSFDRSDPVFLDYREGCHIAGGYPQQVYTDLDGKKKLIVSGITVPALSCVTLEWEIGEVESGASFVQAYGSRLEAPYADIRFAPNGTMESFIDKRANRQLRSGEYPLNTLLLAEDVPTSWDNWDIDADIEGKFSPCSHLLSSEVIADSAAVYIRRSVYRVTEKSTLTQDMILFPTTAEIRFDTALDWNDDHRLLKACFDTAVCEDFARQEIQFGYVKRPTTRNNSIEQAKFEVLNHKYTDLSESRFGVAILNDCKYGMTLNGGRLALSLHKGGVRPDQMGDKDGMHRFVYSFLPHSGPFCAEQVIRPAYCLNYPVIEADGRYDAPTPAAVDAGNVLIETVKPCEDEQNAYLVRLYEAEGTYANVCLTLPPVAKRTAFVNMLEETIEESDIEGGLSFAMKPFEIKTVKVYY